MMRFGLAAVIFAGLGGCMHMDARGEPDAARPGATIRAADGAERGTARVTVVNGALRVTVEGAGLAPGPHGLHIHAVGKCDAPDFATAGPHWNPTMKAHGRDNPGGPHMGDLPNLVIGADGRGAVAFDIAGTAPDLFDADGAAIVVHGGSDDYRTDPSGNSGARVACAVLLPG